MVHVDASLIRADASWESLVERHAGDVMAATVPLPHWSARYWRTPQHPPPSRLVQKPLAALEPAPDCRDSAARSSRRRFLLPRPRRSCAPQPRCEEKQVIPARLKLNRPKPTPRTGAPSCRIPGVCDIGVVAREPLPDEGEPPREHSKQRLPAAPVAQRPHRRPAGRRSGRVRERRRVLGRRVLWSPRTLLAAGRQRRVPPRSREWAMHRVDTAIAEPVGTGLLLALPKMQRSSRHPA